MERTIRVTGKGNISLSPDKVRGADDPAEKYDE